MENAADAARSGYADALAATSILAAWRSNVAFEDASISPGWMFSPYAMDTRPALGARPTRASVGMIAPAPLETVAPPLSRTRRMADVVIALVAIAVFAPMLILISIVIKLTDGGPSLYSQERIGRGGRRFRVWKFRSMVQNADARLAAVLLLSLIHI